MKEDPRGVEFHKPKSIFESMFMTKICPTIIYTCIIEPCYTTDTTFEANTNTLER